MCKTGETVSFEYNEEGLRTKKTTTSTGTTEYTLHGKNIVHMKNGTDEMHFFYGADNKPVIVVYNGTSYRYMYTLQGDVFGLMDESNSFVVWYRYDAWGKPLGVGGTLGNTLGRLQPFRYRGCVWDEETGLYYLRSRFYRASWGRLLNVDVVPESSIYAYCLNNPVMRIDLNGETSCIIANNVRIRSGPSTEYSILSEVPAGTQVDIRFVTHGSGFRGSNEWLYVENIRFFRNGVEVLYIEWGYVHSSFVDSIQLDNYIMENSVIANYFNVPDSPLTMFRSRGVEVRNLQLFLLGQDTPYITCIDDCDGVFGERTYRALIWWQKRNMRYENGINPGDGRLGPKTRNAIFEAYRRVNTSLYYLREYGIIIRNELPN